MAHIVFKGLNKIYDNKVQAVFDFNLEIFDKEFVVFVGPSGCGKTTTLRMLAGLEDISSGEIYIDGELINEVEPKQRDIAMVFQNYALYPHMTVFDNMAFSLQNKKVNKEEIKTRVETAAKILGIEDYLKRKPKALSGGQRQRVALGRAIVRNSKVFLMDEPLSNLDAKLRVQMRIELIRLHREIGATTIYVTHDQTEAMTMATKLVIMNQGRIQQIGHPEEIYENPCNLFVAGFLGSPQTNLIEGVIKDHKFVAADSFSFDLPDKFIDKLAAYENKTVVLSLRPEDIHVEGIVMDTYPSTISEFKLDIKEMLGHDYILYGKIGAVDVTIRTNSRYKYNSSGSNEVAFDLNKIHFFDKDTTNVIV